MKREAGVGGQTLAEDFSGYVLNTAAGDGSDLSQGIAVAGLYFAKPLPRRYGVLPVCPGSSSFKERTAIHRRIWGFTE